MSKKHPEQEVPEDRPEETTAPSAEPAPQPAPEESSGPGPEAQLKAAEERYLRLAAEYENFRKRSARERDALFADVRADTVVKFLPVYDNLLRAIAATPEGDPARKGVEMTLAQFETVLTKLGVTAVEALGKPFDPALHEAVMHVEDEAAGENVIVEEFERGFRLGEKVIRFSKVKVAN